MGNATRRSHRSACDIAGPRHRDDGRQPDSDDARGTARSWCAPPGMPACAMSIPRRSMASARPSGASAMRCATGRATNGCCRPRWDACCGRARRHRRADRRQAGAAAVRGRVRLFLRRHHALGGGQLSSASAWRRSTSCCARYRRLSARRRGQCRAHEGAARERLSRAGGTAPHRRGQRDRHRREREGGADRGDGLRRLGRVPARRPLHAAGAGAAGRPAADVRGARHIDRGGRAVEFRHPGGARHLELCRGAAGDRGAGECDPRGVRRARRAVARGGVAVPAGASGGGGDHSGSALGGRVRGQHAADAAGDSRRRYGAICDSKDCCIRRRRRLPERQASFTSGTRRTACAGSARSMPPTAPAPARAACPPDR